MRADGDTLVMLMPAFPDDEAATHWVPSQQLLVRAIKRNFPQYKLIVLAFQYPERPSTYWWNGVQVISFGGMRHRKFQRLLLWKRIWKTLARIKKEHRVMGLFSCWCGECALLGKYFGARYGIPHYCWLCGQDARKSNRMVRLIRPLSGELIAMSDFLRREFYKNHGIHPARVISNGIDPSLFEGPDLPSRDIDIFAAGSLSPLKQYEMLVQVLVRIRQIIPAVRALHAGDGSEREKINALIETSGLTNNLSLLGELPHAGVLQRMKRSRIFLHPSSYEGYGVVCLEALHAGAHVVSFCDPTGQRIEHWHVVNNIGEMYEKVLELLSDPALDHHPVTVPLMDDSVKEIIALFKTGSIHLQAGYAGAALNS
ncbi:MAG TPA: glycosyltransferase [Puia sp.]|nr:glycosyltransferase [Puia sp.]